VVQAALCLTDRVEEFHALFDYSAMDEVEKLQSNRIWHVPDEKRNDPGAFLECFKAI
jgi:hypothetical protein